MMKLGQFISISGFLRSRTQSGCQKRNVCQKEIYLQSSSSHQWTVSHTIPIHHHRSLWSVQISCDLYENEQKRATE